MPTEIFIWVSGTAMSAQVKVNFSMHQVMYTRADGRMMNETARGFICGLTVHIIRDNGRMTCAAERE